MFITSLGHAGLQIEHRGARLQMDPWFSPEGAFQASWFQWPDNSHVMERLKPPDAVAISHEHLDHVDAWWLAQLPKKTAVYVPRYPLSILREKITASGLTNIYELDPWLETEVTPGLHLFFVPERSPMNHDAAMVLRSDNHAVVNANDARLCPLQLREVRARVGHIDLLALQGAGASWYPMVYHYPEDQKKKLSFRKRMAKFGYVLQATRAAQPSLVLPFAGPPAFLDPELYDLNTEMDEGIFPDHEQVANWLQQQGFDNVRFLYPGDSIDLYTREIARDLQWEGFCYADRHRHLASYANRRRAQVSAVKARYPDPEQDLWPVFRAYFEELVTYSPYFNRKIGMKVGFEITGPGGGNWSVDFRDATRGVHTGLDGIAYKYKFQSRWLPAILERRVPWEDFLLSCRIQAWRDPDVYNDHFLGVLKFADPGALGAVEAWERNRRNDESISVRSGDRIFKVQRFCPHAGQDLLEVGEVIQGDIIRCNGHHFEFDLNSGACLNGKVEPLVTELVDGPADAQGRPECSGAKASAADTLLDT
jgi:UDP-MurNAc hydroxylase